MLRASVLKLLWECLYGAIILRAQAVRLHVTGMLSWHVVDTIRTQLSFPFPKFLCICCGGDASQPWRRLQGPGFLTHS